MTISSNSTDGPHDLYAAVAAALLGGRAARSLNELPDPETPEFAARLELFTRGLYEHFEGLARHAAAEWTAQYGGAAHEAGWGLFEVQGRDPDMDDQPPYGDPLGERYGFRPWEIQADADAEDADGNPLADEEAWRRLMRAYQAGEPGAAEVLAFLVTYSPYEYRAVRRGRDPHLVSDDELASGLP